MNQMEQWLQGLDVSKEIAYPCDRLPGCFNENEKQFYVTARSQVRIRKKGAKNWELFSPSLYQSSMQPERKEIRTLRIEIKEDSLILQTRYGEKEVDVTDVELEVSEWIPRIHKVDCKRCENCGRCGW